MSQNPIDKLKNTDLESLFLSALLYRYKDFTAKIKDYDFVDNRYAEIYRIINQERTTDLNIIASAYERSGNQNGIQTITALAAREHVEGMSADRYAKEIQELSLRRERANKIRLEWKKTIDLNCSIDKFEPIGEFELDHNVAPEITRPADHGDDFIDSLDKSNFIGVASGWPEFDKVLGGTRSGETTVISGNTSSGKSTFGINWLYQLAARGVKGMVLPFERSVYLALRKLLEIHTESSLYRWSKVENTYIMNYPPEVIGGHIMKLNDLPIYIFDKRRKSSNGHYSLDRMGSLIKYAAEELGIKYFLIDHLHYFISHQPGRSDESVISETVRCVHSWGEDYGAHMALVTHPDKANAENVGVMSGKGSSAIGQEADNFIAIQKNAELYLSKIQIKKNAAYGRLGEIEFKVHENGNKFYELEPENKSNN